MLVGDWHSKVHEDPASLALSSLGHQVCGFAWHTYFSSRERLTGLWNRFQNKYLMGPQIRSLNADLLAEAAKFRPELVFVYRGTHILPSTIRQMHECLPGLVIIGYNNDDPFAPAQPRWLWRHFLACLPEYDAALAYRHHNLEDFSRHGARRVFLLRSWFVPAINHPVKLSPEEKSRFRTDVVFIGHFEDDGRLQMLEEIVKQGMQLKLFGPVGWDEAVAKSPWLRPLGPIRPVWGDDYNKALCGAKVALCFFSRLNRDSYTRRCFEIPATGTLMLSEYSEDLAAMFTEGRDADYFRSTEELIGKLRLYLTDDSRRASVAASGLRRVHADGHDVQSRLRAMLQWLAAEGLLKDAHAG